MGNRGRRQVESYEVLLGQREMGREKGRGGGAEEERSGEGDGKPGAPNPGMQEGTFQSRIFLSREKLKGNIKCRHAYKEK